MRFAHALPFGATWADGAVNFRFWAPAEHAVTVRIDGGRDLPMTPAGDGWFESTVKDAKPETRYRYVLADGLAVPDPASRFQSGDVHGWSVVVDPAAYEWQHGKWRGRPWAEAVLYELHVGTFTREASYDGVRARLGELKELGVTAVEFMPLADFRGKWNWGYDGVLPYAPDETYGTPDQLKQLIDAAHGLGLMVFLDVVYNHFGPDGNYLHRYAPQFFTEKRHTPWGAAIDYARPAVRDFFVHNALYWIQEYRFDGLRLDAVHEIIDERRPTILQDIATAVREAVGPDRHVHLVLENDDNSADLLARGGEGRPVFYTAQWDDDVHHAAHAVLTRESSGYYADYADDPVRRLARGLAEGFIYQGELSPYRGRPRGQRSNGLPLVAFVNFLQNHDQVGNRAFGDRLTAIAKREALCALSAIYLLSPGIPMLFMGEEWGAPEPFCFFTNFEGDLADAVREGRRKEFARFADFADPASRERIPDPQAKSTYRNSILDWSKRGTEPQKSWLAHYRELLRVRAKEIVPRIAAAPPEPGHYKADPSGLLTIHWSLADRSHLRLVAQLSGSASSVAPGDVGGRVIWSTSPGVAGRKPLHDLPPWFVAFFLEST